MAFGTIMGQGLNLPGNLVEVRKAPYTPPIGTKVNFMENGENHSYIIIHNGNPNTNIYDDSCDGVWVMREQCIRMTIKSPIINNLLFHTTELNTYLQVDFFNSLENPVKNAIKQVKVPYYDGIKTHTKNNGYLAKIIAGSPLEYNMVIGMPYPTHGVDGSKLSYFSYKENPVERTRADNDDRFPVDYCLRQPLSKTDNVEAGTQYRMITSSGSLQFYNPGDSTLYLRPMFILPKDYFSTKVLYTLDGQFIMDVPET